MLAMFSPNVERLHETTDTEQTNAPAAAPRASPPPSTDPGLSNKVLARVEEIAKAQVQQEALMRSLDSRTRTLVSSLGNASARSPRAAADRGASRAVVPPNNNRSDRASDVAMPLKAATHTRRRRTQRSASWTWDPQVQKDLEKGFEALHVKDGHHTCPAPRDATASEVKEVRFEALPGTPPQPSDETRGSSSTATDEPSGTTTCDRSPSLSASKRLRVRWAQAKVNNRALRLLLDKRESRRNSSRQPIRSSSTSTKTPLRSSWLYRQRAAGRIGKKEHGVCSTFCASYALSWLPIVPPHARLAKLWDSLIAVAVLYVAVLTPMQAAFYAAFDGTWWHLANLLSESLFLAHLIYRFRCGFTHDGVYIDDPHFIAAHYLRGQFLSDAISAFPYAWLLGVRLAPEPEGAPSRSVAERMLPLLRVVRLIVPLVRHLSADKYQTSGSGRRWNPGIARVLRLVVIFFLTCHWIGCIWWCVSELEQDGLVDYGVDYSDTNATRWDPESLETWGPSVWLRTTQPMANQYAHALLWGAGMMTGFVPRDVVPHTLLEVTVTVLAIFFGLIVNTAIISSTTSALQSISFKSSRVVHKMENIAQHMRLKRVPAPLARKIHSFYEYQLSPYRSGEGQQELSDLPPVLAMELIMHTNQELFRECPIFRLVPPPTALSLVEHFEPVVFVPGEIVIHEGKPNAALYVINRGLVSVWRQDDEHPDGKRKLTTLTDSDFFGEQTLLKTITSKSSGGENAAATPCMANATCQCASYCDMFRLTSDDFMAVIDEARSRQVSWEGKDVAGILNDAADQRNFRATSIRRRASRWERAGKEALRQTRAKRQMRSDSKSRLRISGGISVGSSSSRLIPRPKPRSQTPEGGGSRIESRRFGLTPVIAAPIDTMQDSDLNA